MVYLEDESGRIALAGELVSTKLAPILVTGVMIAVKGKLDNDNTKFLVSVTHPTAVSVLTVIYHPGK